MFTFLHKAVVIVCLHIATIFVKPTWCAVLRRNLFCFLMAVVSVWDVLPLALWALLAGGLLTALSMIERRSLLDKKKIPRPWQGPL